MAQLHKPDRRGSAVGAANPVDAACNSPEDSRLHMTATAQKAPLAKRVLILPYGHALSHVTRPLGIARALRDFGYEVIFAGEGRYLDLPRQAGFPVLPLYTLDHDWVMGRSRAGRTDWWSAPLLERSVEAELALFAEQAPDVVLGDFRYSLSISCERAKVAYASLLNAAWTNYYTVRDRAPEHFAPTQLLGQALVDRLVPWLKAYVLWADNGPARRLRRRMGLRPRRNVFDSMRGDLNLLADIPEYGPTRDLPSDFHYVGPLVWEPELPPPAWLAELDPERPTLYVTMGSTGHARFFDEAMRLFGDTEYQCIITTGGLAQIDRAPANFRVAEFAPGGAILERSDLVVCQGGHGTIYQAMKAGVPIVGIPTLHDQEFNLDRVQSLGLGVRLYDLSFRPAHLKSAVERVLADRGYRDRMARFAARLSAYDAPRTAAALIARL
jgi:UDP:flavonoid glycosyltransferase YjiC (YdhE family)